MHLVIQTLLQHANAEKAKQLAQFFQTGKGQYAENDLFLGIPMPMLRILLKPFSQASFDTIHSLLISPYHEARMSGLILLVGQYHAKEGNFSKDEIFAFYVGHRAWINNWDLVDVSAAKIIGEHLLKRDRCMLYQWMKEEELWTRRIAIVATHRFIRADEFEDTFQIAKYLLKDNALLIHKAVGWMLREVGKRNRQALELFLKMHAPRMPRTALRYAIEHFSETERKEYLQLKLK